MIIFIDKTSLLIGFALLLTVGCTKNKSNERDLTSLENEVRSKESSTIELAYFTIEGLNLVTSRELMLKKFGEPNNEAIHRHELGTLHTIYYNIENAEIAFEQKNGIVYFSYIEFTDSSEFILKNKYALFSKETKYDPFNLLFHDSVINEISHNGRKRISVKVIDRKNSWIRFEFEGEKLKSINFDTVY